MQAWVALECKSLLALGSGTADDRKEQTRPRRIQEKEGANEKGGGRGRGGSPPIWGPIDADFACRSAGIRMRNHGRHAGEVTHDQGDQIGRHSWGSGKASGCQASRQLFRGHHGHVGESSEACRGGEADVKGSLQSTQQPHIRNQLRAQNRPTSETN